jgi:hypothetical protein
MKRFMMPHIIDKPPIVLINTIKATVLIGAKPSGVEDSNIINDLLILCYDMINYNIMISAMIIIIIILGK